MKPGSTRRKKSAKPSPPLSKSNNSALYNNNSRLTLTLDFPRRTSSDDNLPVKWATSPFPSHHWFLHWRSTTILGNISHGPTSIGQGCATLLFPGYPPQIGSGDMLTCFSPSAFPPATTQPFLLQSPRLFSLCLTAVHDTPSFPVSSWTKKTLTWPEREKGKTLLNLLFCWELAVCFLFLVPLFILFVLFLSWTGWQQSDCFFLFFSSLSVCLSPQFSQLVHIGVFSCIFFCWIGNWNWGTKRDVRLDTPRGIMGLPPFWGIG